ncbi:hypothetical protein BDN67DRAFT_984979 [Paxillus ammoniavirescens]|nr:hypothetical protein BDN67DRAFT_984979 [Paxillus ammoniavirescens]
MSLGGLNQELATLWEHCRVLEFQVVALTTERDTINTSGDNSNIDPILLPMSSASRLTRESHPKIQFWIYMDYLAWKDTSAESHACVRGKLLYLEENSGLVLNETLTDVCQTMHNAWLTLVHWKLAPQSWGQLDTSGRQIFHTLVENAHPLFKFADNGWKLEQLATSTYSSWKKNHIDKLGNWLLRGSVSEDRTSEEEAEFNDNSKSKKRKVKASIKSKDSNKHFKVGSSGLSSGDKVPAPIEVLNPLSILSLAAAGVIIPLAITRPTPITSHTPPSPWVVSADIATAGPTTNVPSTAPSHNSEGIPTLDAVLPVVPIQTPSLMQLLPEHPVPDRNNTNTSAKASKMRIGPKHNGQNLCAHHWLQQFKGKSATAGGTRDQFKGYWDRLGKVKQRVYNNEVNTLVANGGWCTAELEKLLT